ncbi:uncharacterized protein SOCE26_101830 [Sorangium cellulosum]|uniref:Uncharacterized protein n=1 Tax=Sorangium cellulosum TaxID=56 RepID=A0A2L0FAZ2_SORCE|nr:uncharacterized protein SOCE26_101830 [Sorangium cellulosum]
MLPAGLPGGLVAASLSEMPLASFYNHRGHLVGPGALHRALRGRVHRGAEWIRRIGHDGRTVGVVCLEQSGRT